MRLFNRKGLVARRAYRASLPPTLIGLVTFSFVLVVFGGTVYAAAVPALIVQNPVVQTLSQAVSSPALFSAETPEKDASSDAGAASASASDSKAATGSAGGAGISFSSVVSPLAAPSVGNVSDAPSEGEPSPEGGAGDASQGGGAAPQNPPAGDVPGGNQGDAPVQPAPPGENQQAEDEAFRATLVAYYDGLASHANAVNELYSQFNAQCLNPDRDARYQCFSDAHREFNALSGVSSELNSMKAPSGSAYTAAFEDIKVLYNDLGSATAILRRAWMINVEMSDPSKCVDDFMAPLRERTGPDGKIIYLSDFEQRYPGARP